MGTRSIAFRLNSKTKEDQEIMEWLDEVVYKYKIYDTITEAVKWALLCFSRGEIHNHEQMDMLETVQEFVNDFARQSKVDAEKLMQEATNKILAGVLASMNMQAYGYAPAQVQGGSVPQMMSVMQVPVTTSEYEHLEEETGLANSDVPLDDSTKASLAAMFGDDDDD